MAENLWIRFMEEGSKWPPSPSPWSACRCTTRWLTTNSLVTVANLHFQLSWYNQVTNSLLRHEMHHFVRNLEGYLSNQILNVTWSEFQEGLLNVSELKTRLNFNFTLCFNATTHTTQVVTVLFCDVLNSRWIQRKCQNIGLRQDFSRDENWVSSEGAIFIFHTVKISLSDFLDNYLHILKDNDGSLQ